MPSAHCQWQLNAIFTDRDIVYILHNKVSKPMYKTSMKVKLYNRLDQKNSIYKRKLLCKDYLFAAGGIDLDGVLRKRRFPVCPSNIS